VTAAAAVVVVVVVDVVVCQCSVAFMFGEGSKGQKVGCFVRGGVMVSTNATASPV